jgi:phospholipid/cholesterol/gamma-HCH transport system substrate-binding protein
MAGFSSRRQHILTGAIALVLTVAATTVGIKGSFGAFDSGYELIGSFDAAGQGLLAGSDVKVRGVNIGEVRSISLVDGDALLKLRIDDGERIPADASATIRPKTLFGEKFVDIDPGPAEEDGPFLGDGDELVNTLGGVELEQVLADLYPILEAVEPDELMTVLGELADAGDGMGETINRSIVNGEKLTTLFAENADLTTKFLTDFAALSDQLAVSADDLLGVADAASVALPTLNGNEGALVELLQQTGRLSNDVADLLEGNTGFVQASLGDGTRALDTLYGQRDQIVPLVTGLRDYVRMLAVSIRIDVGDGTLMAAVKGVLGGEACGVLPCPGAELPADASPVPPPPGPDSLLPTVPGLPLPPLDVLTGEGGLVDLLTRILG